MVSVAVSVQLTFSLAREAPVRTTIGTEAYARSSSPSSSPVGVGASLSIGRRRRATHASCAVLYSFWRHLDTSGCHWEFAHVVLIFNTS